MKPSLLLLPLPLALTASLAARAQVGIGTTAPDPKAALEIKAADKGLLIPRLTETARLTLANSPQGLLVFQRDGAQPGFWYATGSGNAWLYLPDAATAHDNLGDGVARTSLNLNGNKLLGGTAASPSPDGLQVDGSGRVGISLGAATPTEQLQVDGGNLKVGSAQWATTANDRQLRFGDGSYVALGETGGDDLLQFQAKDFRFNPSPVGSYTGNVGIGLGTGTAASERLEVGGNIKITGTAGTTGLVFPDGTKQTTAVSGGSGLTLPYSGSANPAASGPVFQIMNTGSGSGLRGASASGQGVVGRVNGTGAGQGVVGVKGTSVPNITNAGVVGLADTDPAVYAASNSNSAVVATTSATGTGLAAVQGTATASGGVGVSGTATDSYGVLGSSSSGNGVQGISTSGYGAQGQSTSSAGVYGSTAANSNTTAGVQGVGTNGNNAVGVLGLAQGGYGVRGEAATSPGAGVYGKGTGTYGVFGISDTGRGVYGVSTSSYGVQGYSTSSYGVYGSTAASNTGTAAGLWGSATSNGGVGVLGQTSSGNGVRGEATGSSGYGVSGTASGSGGCAFIGSATGAATGLYATASGTGRAAYFNQTNGGSSAYAVEINQAGSSAALNVSGGAVRTPAVTTPSTGTANMVPVAYSHIMPNGTIVSGSGNFTITPTSTGRYTVTFTSANLANQDLRGSIIPVAGFVRPGPTSTENAYTVNMYCNATDGTASVETQLLGASNTGVAGFTSPVLAIPADCEFSFVVYKP